MAILQKAPDGSTHYEHCQLFSADSFEVANGCDCGYRDPALRKDLEGWLRLIVESYRDAPNPSVDIAVEELVITFDSYAHALREFAIRQLVVHEQRDPGTAAAIVDSIDFPLRRP